MSMRDAILKVLTGLDEQNLHDQVALGKSAIKLNPTGSNLDKGTHEIASEKIANRWGPLVARALGGGKELTQGVLSLARGKSFFDPEGYDVADIEANEVGISRAEDELRKKILSRGR